MRSVERVDIERFMGEWYVIANIPTFIERGAHNAVESYKRLPDGSIDTVFSFNDGAFDGARRRYNPRGFVLDPVSNAIWGMRFIWPIKADYRIIHLTPDYRVTVIGREARDYLWVMARTPQIDEGDYREALAVAMREGYDIARVERVPQQPLAERVSGR